MQEDHELWESKLPRDYKEIIQMSKCPEIYATIKKEELYSNFSKGILLQQDKVWLSCDNNGERNEMVSATTFSYIDNSPHQWKSLPESRFLGMTHQKHGFALVLIVLAMYDITGKILGRFETTVEMFDISNLNIKIQTKPLFSSHNVDYGAFLVFKFSDSHNFSSKPMYVNLKYRKGYESQHAYFATWRDKEWMMIELDRYSNHKEDVVFEFLLESFSSYHCGDGAIYVEGIEFRAIQKVKLEDIGKSEEAPQVLKSNFSVTQLATKFKDTFKKYPNYEDLFWFDNVNGKKLLMLSAKATILKFSDVNLYSSRSTFKKYPNCRFRKVGELLPQQVFHISCTIENQMLSPDTEYACYIVFKISKNCQGLHYPVKVRDLLHHGNESEFVYFIIPNLLNINDITGVPKQREDGWMEIQLCKFSSAHELENDSHSTNMRFTSQEGTMSGLIVYGLEFRSL
ncbi:kinase-like domain, phloem protein 2-like protein [Tanacetum coccineum]